jgi:hypothetical protein
MIRRLFRIRSADDDGATLITKSISLLPNYEPKKPPQSVKEHVSLGNPIGILVMPKIRTLSIHGRLKSKSI